MTGSPMELPPLQRARERLAAGAPQEAEALIWQAIDQDPRQSTAWMQLGQLLTRTGRLGDAVEAYLRVAELDPDDVASRTALGVLFRNMSFPEEAIHWHGEALALQPDSLVLNLNHLFVLPVVATSTAEIERLRQRCLEGFAALQPRISQLQLTGHEMPNHPFYLIYHNRDDRATLESYGHLMRHFAQSKAQPLRASSHQTTRPGSGRKRIGFLSGFFSNHSNSLAFEGLIRHLDRNRFEVVVIHLHSTKKDEITDRINRCVDRHVTLSGTYRQALRRLDALKLDLLYFTDIGMHPMSTLLGCSRSAPLQITGWGIPQTSGLSGIDYYISSDLVEPVDGDDHYTETLVRLPGLPCCYLSEHLSPVSLSRDFFLLPPQVPLYGCLQSPWKMHPDFDGLLEQIACQVPEAWFVFIEADLTSHTQIFLERLRSSAPTVSQRLILLSRQERAHFIALAGCLDVLLDPPYFSSGITLYDTIHTGTPIVSLEGRFLRSRYVAGAYRLMGLADAPVARSPEAYVELAVALGRDRERLESLRRRIRECAPSLYDRREGIEAFAAFALEAIEQRRQKP